MFFALSRNCIFNRYGLTVNSKVCRYVRMGLNITLVVDEKVWRVFRAECIRRGLKASQLAEGFMRDTLKKWGVSVEEERPTRKLKK